MMVELEAIIIKQSASGDGEYLIRGRSLKASSIQISYFFLKLNKKKDF